MPAQPVQRQPRAVPDRMATATFHLTDGRILSAPQPVAGQEIKVGIWIHLDGHAHEVTDMRWRQGGGRVLHLDHGAVVLPIGPSDAVSKFTVITPARGPR